LEKTANRLPDINFIIRFVGADHSLSRECMLREGKLVELSPERTTGREHSVTPSPLIATDNVT
jgi:hypothetical protein